MVRTGTSNIVLPGNKLQFPEAFRDASRLKYYASLFNTVEINSSFYKIPRPGTFVNWAAEVSGDFQFSVKLFKEITHAKSLLFDPALISKFMEAATCLGKKLGPVLIQFPGKIGIDYYNEVEEILQQVTRYGGDHAVRIAVEFRNRSWYIREVHELLDQYHASLVLHDIPASATMDVNKGAPFIYMRFHGTKGDYRGTYENDTLDIYAEKIREWKASGKDVYVYFNNTIGAAFNNAITLSQKLVT